MAIAVSGQELVDYSANYLSTPLPKIITADYWAQFADKNAAKRARRQRNDQIADKLAAESMRRVRMVTDAAAFVGSLVTCRRLNGREHQGNLLQIQDGVSKQPLHERGLPNTLRLPLLVIHDVDTNSRQELRSLDLLSVIPILPEDLPLRWQGDDN